MKPAATRIVYTNNANCEQEMIIKKQEFTFYILIFLAFTTVLTAQDKQKARAIIDTLRWGFDYKSAEAFRRANRAKQLDSTYYVTYLIEGFHYYDRAEEFTGLRRALKPLRKAIRLFENDFGYCLNKRYTREEIILNGAWRELLLQVDYLTLSSTLVECYTSLEMPDSAYNALIRLRDADLAFDFRSYQGLAWLYFRSRIFTSDDYSFLKDSIEENIRMAFLYTDSLEMKFTANKPYLRSQIMGAYMEGSGFYNFFQSAFIDQTLETIANTRGILYGYNFKPQVAASYFLKMKDKESVAKPVNLGYAYLSDLDLRRSEQYFSSVPDKGSKTRGGHWQGYSTIFVSRGEPLSGALQLYENRDKYGYTIGYGWDNLCLARMYLYAGMLEECSKALDKAENFTEVHFNTSFREDQYQFMLKTLRFLQSEFALKANRFEHQKGWLSLAWWKSLPKLVYIKFKNLYHLANDLALNPERDIVYYHIIHTESIITFDELWYIIRNYSNEFFRKTFSRFKGMDPRENLKRYYDYFIAKLELENGKDAFAYEKLTAILSDPRLDKEYEKLLVARVHESCARIAAEKGWEPQLAFHLNEMYRIYPQLIPFSDVQMAFRLKISQDMPENMPVELRTAISQLKGCNINWNPPEDQNYPEVHLRLEKGDRLAFQVIMNQEVVTQGAVDVTRPDAGKTLAYRLFKVAR